MPDRSIDGANVIPLPTSDTPVRGGPEADSGARDHAAAREDLGQDPSEPVVAPDLGELIEEAIRVALGVASTVAAVAADALTRSMGRERRPSDEPADPAGASLLTGAALGLGFELGRRTLETAVSATRALRPVWSWSTSPGPVRRPIGSVESKMLALNERWREARPGAENAADLVASAIVPTVAGAILDQLDLTQLVSERVDINALVADVDVDAIVGRVDLAVVVDRIDIDAVAERIDLEAVISRIDLATLAQEVIEEVDLPELMRESTGVLASETVEGVRVQGMHADRAVANAIDRVLFRRAERRLDAPGTGEKQNDEPSGAGS